MKRTILSIFLGCFCLVGVIWNAFADQAREYNAAKDSATHARIDVARTVPSISIRGNRDDAIQICQWGMDQLIRNGAAWSRRLMDRLSARNLFDGPLGTLYTDFAIMNMPKWELVVLEEPSATSPLIKFQCNYYLPNQP